MVDVGNDFRFLRLKYGLNPKQNNIQNLEKPSEICVTINGITYRTIPAKLTIGDKSYFMLELLEEIYENNTR